MSATGSTDVLLNVDVDEADAEFRLPSWSKGAYLTSSEEEMITTSLPVYDPARFARAGSPLLVLTDFPVVCNQDQTTEDSLQVLKSRHITDNATKRAMLTLLSFLGISMLVIGFLSYVHI